jgi:hypothetical protein
MIIGDFDVALEHIKKYFGFLFEGDIKLLETDLPNHFAGFFIIFEKPEFRIRFVKDRSTITMQIGTHQSGLGWSVDGWYDIVGIIMYLTQQQILITEYMDNVDSDLQLERLGKAFQFFYDQILDLFKPENFLEQEETLHLVLLKSILIAGDPERKAEREKLFEKSKKFWESIGIYMENNNRRI